MLFTLQRAADRRFSKGIICLNIFSYVVGTAMRMAKAFFGIRDTVLCRNCSVFLLFLIFFKINMPSSPPESFCFVSRDVSSSPADRCSTDLPAFLWSETRKWTSLNEPSSRLSDRAFARSVQLTSNPSCRRPTSSSTQPAPIVFMLCSVVTVCRACGSDT